MIVHSMSAEKKLHELKLDYWSLQFEIEAAYNSYRRQMKQLCNSEFTWGCSIVPRRVKLKSRNHNHWTILIYLKNDEFVNSYYVTVPGDKNTYIIFVPEERNRYMAYEFTPHFLQRYRERLLIPSGSNLSGSAALEDYLLRTGDSVYYKDENGTHYTISKHGFVVAQSIIPHYLLVKTYIAKDETFSKRKAELSDKLAGFLDFFVFIHENASKLTYEILEEQLRKCEMFDEEFMKAFAQKFRPGRPIDLYDFEAFRRELFGLE